jgi:hypothetical protein
MLGFLVTNSFLPGFGGQGKRLARSRKVGAKKSGRFRIERLGGLVYTPQDCFPLALHALQRPAGFAGDAW